MVASGAAGGGLVQGSRPAAARVPVACGGEGGRFEFVGAVRRAGTCSSVAGRRRQWSAAQPPPCADRLSTPAGNIWASIGWIRSRGLCAALWYTRRHLQFKRLGTPSACCLPRGRPPFPSLVKERRGWDWGRGIRRRCCQLGVGRRAAESLLCRCGRSVAPNKRPCDERHPRTWWPGGTTDTAGSAHVQPRFGGVYYYGRREARGFEAGRVTPLPTPNRFPTDRFEHTNGGLKKRRGARVKRKGGGLYYCGLLCF